VSETHALYRFFNHDGQLLYVGITLNLGSRLTKHRDDKPWWAEVARVMVAQFDSREEVLAAEKVAIRTEQPKYNIQYNEAVIERRQQLAPVGLGVLRPGDIVAACLVTGECPLGEITDVDERGFRLTHDWSAKAPAVAIVLWPQVERILVAGPPGGWDDETPVQIDKWPLYKLRDYWRAHRMPRFACAKCGGEFYVERWNDGGLCGKCWNEEAPF